MPSLDHIARVYDQSDFLRSLRPRGQHRGRICLSPLNCQPPGHTAGGRPHIGDRFSAAIPAASRPLQSFLPSGGHTNRVSADIQIIVSCREAAFLSQSSRRAASRAHSGPVHGLCRLWQAQMRHFSEEPKGQIYRKIRLKAPEAGTRGQIAAGEVIPRMTGVLT